MDPYQSSLVLVKTVCMYAKKVISVSVIFKFVSYLKIGKYLNNSADTGVMPLFGPLLFA